MDADCRFPISDCRLPDHRTIGNRQSPIKKLPVAPTGGQGDSICCQVARQPIVSPSVSGAVVAPDPVGPNRCAGWTTFRSWLNPISAIWGGQVKWKVGGDEGLGVGGWGSERKGTVLVFAPVPSPLPPVPCFPAGQRALTRLMFDVSNNSRCCELPGKLSGETSGGKFPGV